MRKLSALALAASLVFGLAACSDDSSSFNKDDAVQQLMDEGGLTEEQATCIVDAVEDEFGVDKLESQDELTDEDATKLGEITLDCLGGDLGGLLDGSIPTDTTE